MNEEALLPLIYSRLAGPQGYNLALVASTGRAATKVLRQIGDPSVYGPYLPDASQWTFAYVSAAQFGSHDTAKDFWDRVWQAFADKSVARPQEALLREMVDKWPPRTYGRNLRQLDQQQLRLVLLLEGMDKLTSKTRLFTFDLTSSLRTLSSREPSFSVVFSSRRRLSELNRLVATRGSPPFNNFDEILL